jgi:glycosyltransferase involved in cell wall biosynthesis
MTRTVLVNAGPWLGVPPAGYGGIENVVATLVPALRAHGHRVVLATVGESTLEADDYLRTFERGQFAHIARPYNRTSGIAQAHMHQVVRALRRRDDVDVVHDHLEVVGPATLAAMGTAAPPSLHTLHWDLLRHPDFYAVFDGGGRVFVNGVSTSQLERGHPNLRAQAVGAVPLATPIPAEPPARERAEHALVLGRITPGKGQDTAARVCRKLGHPLVLAGPVASAAGPAELDAALADPAHPLHRDDDVRFFIEEVRPHLDGETVRWVGTVGGATKTRLLRTARALLMPIRWAEPGATVVAEALAAGTPVVGTRFGVLPSLVDHGETGWLADSEAELAELLARAGEIEPARCRAVAEERYSPARMASSYAELYEDVIARAG